MHENEAAVNSNVLNLSQQKIAKLRGVSNFDVIPAGDREDKIPKSVSEIWRGINFLCGAWPKRVGAVLFVLDERGAVQYLTKQSEFFAWIQRQGINVWWSSGAGCISKQEFFDAVKGLAERFDSADELPYFPKRPDVFCQFEPSFSFTPHLDDLSNFFKFSSEHDRILFKALFCTVFWSNFDGSKPLFIITAEEDDEIDGRGVGKTTIVKMIGRLVGGTFDASFSEGIEGIKKRLLMTKARIVLYDNIKSYRLSSGDVEGLITSRFINGHLMYHGEHSIPNKFTYVMTYNDPSLSKDLAQRAVVIRVARPEWTPDWEDRVISFIDEAKDDILAEIASIFAKDPMPINRALRFGKWSREVLMRVSPDDSVADYIINSINTVDGEVNEKQEAEDCIFHNLGRYHIQANNSIPLDIEKNIVLVRKGVMHEWLKIGLNIKNISTVSISKKLARMKFHFISKEEKKIMGTRYYILFSEAVDNLGAEGAPKVAYAIDSDERGNSSCRLVHIRG